MTDIKLSRKQLDILMSMHNAIGAVLGKTAQYLVSMPASDNAASGFVTAETKTKKIGIKDLRGNNALRREVLKAHKGGMSYGKIAKEIGSNYPAIKAIVEENSK